MILTAPEVEGDYELVVALTDALGTITVTETLSVRSEKGETSGGNGDGGDGIVPSVSVVAPLAETTLSSPIEVVGTVDDADLASWTLSLVDGIGEPLVLAVGDSPVANGALGTLDPTLLTNGARRLRLAATDRGGLTRAVEVPLVIDGDMKVGNFSITFEDLAIPMVGIPIEITRTYDSRRRHEALDFGHGWSIDYQNVTVSRDPRRLG